MRPLGVGCIGLGRMGQIFVEHLSAGIPEARLVAVADPLPGLAERTAARYGARSWFEDDIRTEVLGSAGALLIGALQQTPVLLLTREGGRHDVVPYILERFGGSYLAELRHFLSMVRGDGGPGPTIYDGRAGVEIALAATSSYREGRPVSLPLRP